jgi:chromate transporter
MNDSNNLLVTLFLLFVPLSLLSVGGGVSIIAPLHHQTISVFAWLTEQQFVEVFAISRAAPGPGSMIVPLIGWKVSGFAGTIVASIGMFLPSSILAYGVARLWNRYRGTNVHAALERGLAAIAAGLILAGTLAIFQAAGTGWQAWGIAGGSAAILYWRDINPLWLLFGGGVLYAVAMHFIR